MPDQIQSSARGIDLSSRIAVSTTVVASPAAAAETIVAQVTTASGLTIVSGVFVMGWLAYTLGTSAASARVRIRQTNVAGAVVADSAAMTGGHNTAGQLVSDDINGFDAAPPTPGTYVMTLQIASGAAASTVSSVWLVALAV